MLSINTDFYDFYIVIGFAHLWYKTPKYYSSKSFYR